MTSDHVSDICPHLLIALDLLNASKREYPPWSRLDHSKIMIFGKIDIKRAGGCYKSISTEKPLERFPIVRTPRGYVHIPTVGREIDW